MYPDTTHYDDHQATEGDAPAAATEPATQRDRDFQTILGHLVQLNDIHQGRLCHRGFPDGWIRASRNIAATLRYAASIAASPGASEDRAAYVDVLLGLKREIDAEFHGIRDRKRDIDAEFHLIPEHWYVRPDELPSNADVLAKLSPPLDGCAADSGAAAASDTPTAVDTPAARPSDARTDRPEEPPTESPVPTLVLGGRRVDTPPYGTAAALRTDLDKQALRLDHLEELLAGTNSCVQTHGDRLGRVEGHTADLHGRTERLQKGLARANQRLDGLAASSGVAAAVDGLAANSGVAAAVDGLEKDGAARKPEVVPPPQKPRGEDTKGSETPPRPASDVFDQYIRPWELLHTGVHLDWDSWNDPRVRFYRSLIKSILDEGRRLVENRYAIGPGDYRTWVGEAAWALRVHFRDLSATLQWLGKPALQFPAGPMPRRETP